MILIESGSVRRQEREEMLVEVNVGGEKISIKCERKRMRSIRLRVAAGGVIRLSAPYGVSAETVRRFAQKNAGWIEKQLSRAAALPPQSAITYAAGASILLLGKEREIVFREQKKRSVETDEEHITVCCEDEKIVAATLEKWWRKSAGEYFAEVMRRYYPAVAALTSFPVIAVKKMSSRWGSCSAEKERVNLNYYLFCAPEECVEYVVMHELAHFAERGHGKRFYAFIERFMPDWKERRALLRRLSLI